MSGRVACLGEKLRGGQQYRQGRRPLIKSLLCPHTHHRVSSPVPAAIPVRFPAPLIKAVSRALFKGSSLPGGPPGPNYVPPPVDRGAAMYPIRSRSLCRVGFRSSIPVVRGGIQPHIWRTYLARRSHSVSQAWAIYPRAPEKPAKFSGKAHSWWLSVICNIGGKGGG